MNRLFTITALALVIVFGSVGALMAADETATMIKEDLKVQPLTGEATTLKSMVAQSDRTALVFMQTACAACRSEMRWLMKQKEANDKLNIIAISVDLRGKPAVDKYLEMNPVFKDAVTFVLDPEYTLPPMFGFSYTPSMAIVDKSGKVLAQHAGWNPKDLDEVMKALR